MQLTSEQASRREGFGRAAADLLSAAGEWDAAGAVPEEAVVAIANEGWLGAAVPEPHGGTGLDSVSFGLLCEEVGRLCSSTRSLLTVQAMVAASIARWGTAEQRERWLPRLASGDAVAAFCLTEPEVGSDAASVSAPIEPADGGWRLSGLKRWVTFGSLADVYLVIGRSAEGPAAVLVEAGADGVHRRPAPALLGLRAAHVCDVVFDAAPAHMLAKPGLGFTHVASTALDHGRHSVAWGCVGIAQAALEASLDHAREREQFGAPIADHQLVRRLLSEMAAGTKAARLLCWWAATLRDGRDPRAMAETIVAKYVSARTAERAASDAVQVHGAVGCSGEAVVERLLRDAKVMRIIEGSDQMHQLAIADYAYRERDAQRGTPG